MDPGVAARAHLALTMSTRFIDAQIAGRRWRRLNDGVVVLHNGPLTKEQARLAVYLSAQRPAALCSLTATEMCGLRGFETEAVHILVRRGARVMPVPGVVTVVHESRRFGEEDVATTYSPARVGVERAVIDAAVWSRTAAEGARIVAASVQQRLTRPSDLADELMRAGKVAHRRALFALLADLDGGAQALSEVEFMRFCRRHRLPKPVMNVRCDATGRRRYLDAVLKGPNGTVVRVEIDGGIHLSLAARWQDTRRDNDYVLSGAPMLRYPSIAIYTDDPVAVSQLRAALGLVST